jgi:hypothetical protein
LTLPPIALGILDLPQAADVGGHGGVDAEHVDAGDVAELVDGVLKVIAGAIERREVPVEV